MLFAGRGGITCLMCNGCAEYSLLDNRSILIGIKLLYQIDRYTIMLEASKICLNCAGRLHQLFDFGMIKTNLDLNREGFTFDTNCQFCDEETHLISHKHSHKVKEALNGTKWQQVYENRSLVEVCFACFNFLLLYKEILRTLEQQVLIFYKNITRWKVMVMKSETKDLNVIQFEDAEATRNETDKVLVLKNASRTQKRRNSKKRAQEDTSEQPSKKKRLRNSSFLLKQLEIEDCNANLELVDKFTEIKQRRSKSLPGLKPSTATNRRKSKSRMNSKSSNSSVEEVMEVVEFEDGKEMEVVTNETEIETNVTKITSNETEIMTLETETKKNVTKIATLETETTKNETEILENPEILKSTQENSEEKSTEPSKESQETPEITQNEIKTLQIQTEITAETAPESSTDNVVKETPEIQSSHSETQNEIEIIELDDDDSKNSFDLPPGVRGKLIESKSQKSQENTEVIETAIELLGNVEQDLENSRREIIKRISPTTPLNNELKDSRIEQKINEEIEEKSQEGERKSSEQETILKLDSQEIKVVVEKCRQPLILPQMFPEDSIPVSETPSQVSQTKTKPTRRRRAKEKSLSDMLHDTLHMDLPSMTAASTSTPKPMPKPIKTAKKLGRPKKIKTEATSNALEISTTPIKTVSPEPSDSSPPKIPTGKLPVTKSKPRKSKKKLKTSATPTTSNEAGSMSPLAMFRSLINETDLTPAAVPNNLIVQNVTDFVLDSSLDKLDLFPHQEDIMNLFPEISDVASEVVIDSCVSFDEELKNRYGLRNCSINLKRLSSYKIKKILGKRKKPTTKVTKSGRVAKPSKTFDPSPERRSKHQKEKPLKIKMQKPKKFKKPEVIQVKELCLQCPDGFPRPEDIEEHYVEALDENIVQAPPIVEMEFLSPIHAHKDLDDNEDSIFIDPQLFLDLNDTNY